MKILIAASEAVPFSKTGGLADVVGALAQQLKRMGVDVRVIVPKYKGTKGVERLKQVGHFNVGLGWRNRYCGLESTEHEGVTYYFVDNQQYFERENCYSYADDGERFAFFCRAVLESIQYTGFVPDIIHCNDWQAGLIPAMLKAQYSHIVKMADIKTVYTIHNLKYQGVFPIPGMNEMLGLPAEYLRFDGLEYFGNLNCMKGGIVYCDALTTVSPTYAKEIQTGEYGEGLDGTVRAHSAKLHGILNGIDTEMWNPAKDEHIPTKYSASTFEKKAGNKMALREALGLDVSEDLPVIGMVTRLVDQKGLHLVRDVFDELMKLPVQLAVLGAGEREYEMLFRWAADSVYRGRVGLHLGMNEALAHQIYAGSDIFLMPSLFEPCGISQMMAMRYGSIPLVRETGGLMDTVKPYNEYADKGYGFSFSYPNSADMLYTIRRALDFYSQKEVWSKLALRCMKKDFSWKEPAKKYIQLYNQLHEGTSS